MEETNSRKQGKVKAGSAKVDPSFKSKRYRDKLRSEVKALETLIPVDRPALHRKLDSQTVYRLVIAYLRLKSYFQVCGSVNTQEGGNEDETFDNTVDNVSDNSRTLSQLLSPSTLNQILDGFLLVLSIDGTVLYASENILNYTGFNQMDVIHRCIYGAIHPDDQSLLQTVLEQNGAFSNMESASPKHTRKKSKTIDDQEGSVPVSLFYRMKCFNANSMGYLKLHCTGKIERVLALRRPPKSSDRIALLCCQPFLLHGSDVTCESKESEFWSKHDLDLKIVEVEEKVQEVMGYTDWELQGTSLYSMVHPEDLGVLVNVHRSVTEVNDVQAFYLRLQSKDGSVGWFHSKGKVVCKNSKKFSIVFTHCPIRDEDSTFIQQEATQRRQHGIQDLVNMYKPKLPAHVEDDVPDDRCNFPPQFGQCNGQYQTNASCDFYTQSIAGDPFQGDPQTNQEVSKIFSFFATTCPSTWHTNPDRHSPVVPSSHVAHKLSLREKQLHLAQYKRKQQLLQQTCMPVGYDGERQGNVNNVMQPYPMCVANGYMPQCNTYSSCNTPSVYNSVCHPVYSMRNCAVFQNHETPQGLPRNHFIHCNQPPADVNHATSAPNETFCYVNCVQSELYNYPPSPPPSPRIPMANQSLPYHRYNGNFDTTHKIIDQMPLKQEMAYSNDDCKSSMSSCQGQGHSFQSRTNIRLSMRCNTAFDRMECDGYAFQMGHRIPTFQSQCLPEAYNQRDHMKNDVDVGQSCALSHYPSQVKPPECVQYDIEASIHMKIVESESKSENPRKDVEIPVIESFMDYLNDDE